MKKGLLLVAILLATFGVAQEKIEEGVIVTKQTMSSDNEQMNMQLAMMGDIVSTTYFKGDKARTEVSNPMSGKVVSVSDLAKKEVLITMNNPMVGKKYMVKSLDEAKDENMQVEELSETKEVLGYTCNAYKVKTKMQGVEANIMVYAADVLKNVSSDGYFGGKVKGMPLLTEITANQMGAEIKVVKKVTEIKKTAIEDDKFDMTPPEGYEKTEGMPGM